jgi:hypothetical protein
MIYLYHLERPVQFRSFHSVHYPLSPWMMDPPSNRVALFSSVFPWSFFQTNKQDFYSRNIFTPKEGKSHEYQGLKYRAAARAV